MPLFLKDCLAFLSPEARCFLFGRFLPGLLDLNPGLLASNPA
jgi:hypothetical protein